MIVALRENRIAFNSSVLAFVWLILLKLWLKYALLHCSIIISYTQVRSSTGVSNQITIFTVWQYKATVKVSWQNLVLSALHVVIRPNRSPTGMPELWCVEQDKKFVPWAMIWNSKFFFWNLTHAQFLVSSFIYQPCFALLDGCFHLDIVVFPSIMEMVESGILVELMLSNGSQFDLRTYWRRLNLCCF